MPLSSHTPGPFTPETYLPLAKHRSLCRFPGPSLDPQVLCAELSPMTGAPNCPEGTLPGSPVGRQMRSLSLETFSTVSPIRAMSMLRRRTKSEDDVGDEQEQEEDGVLGVLLDVQVAQAYGELEEFQHRVTEAAVGAAVLMVLGTSRSARPEREDITGCCLHQPLCPVNYSVNSCVPARTHMHTHTLLSSSLWLLKSRL